MSEAGDSLASPNPPGGRPTKYDPKVHPVLVRALARVGNTMEQIAGELQVAPSTLYLWAANFPRLALALRQGREYADARVEDALYRRAVGYSYDSEEEITVDGPDGATHTTKRKRVHVAPDVAAQRFWLKNRKAREWRDKREIVLGGELSVHVAQVREAVQGLFADPAKYELAKKLAGDLKLPAPTDEHAANRQ